MNKVTYYTQEGYDRLMKELDELKTVGRAAAAKAIGIARAQGDLSENAEYDAAKDAQGMLEMKINELEKAMANARVLDESQLSDKQVGILCNVTIENIKIKKEITYKLVSQSEADLKLKKISVSSPIGKALLGAEVDDIVDVETPGGKIQFKIKKITLG